MSAEPTPDPAQPFIALAQHMVAALLPEGAPFSVEASTRRNTITLVIDAPEAYKGRLIGKQGSVVRALRQVLNASALPGARDVDVEIPD